MIAITPLMTAEESQVVIRERCTLIQLHIRHAPPALWDRWAELDDLLHSYGGMRNSFYAACLVAAFYDKLRATLQRSEYVPRS